MDWLTFVESVIRAVAWPAVFVASVYILRRPLGAVITGIVKLRYKDLEVEFGRELARVQEQLQLPRNEKSRAKLEPPPAEAAVADEVLDYYASIAEVSPRAAVLEAWIGFETTAASSARVLDLLHGDRPVPFRQLLAALRKGQLLSDGDISGLTKLRELRNQVVHDPHAHISREDAVRYAWMIRELGEEVAAQTWRQMPKNC